ncbi:VOC family protein [Sphingomonas profundi]|uniref:VOC family protein n=1 Tax=Alterirhizorhabdus profundi TaxID=2681549 RepID=UPI0012E8885F|nr:VOC family protein [Sphingomonas profundi]
MPLDLPVRQIAYFVPDVREAARRHAALFNSGPYFVADNIPLRAAWHRGTPVELDHSSAYGQWGEVMVEFVQQNNPGPSVFRDMYGEGEQGMHHVAIIVADVRAAQAHFEADGLVTALEAEMNDGFVFLMMDGVARYGHMIELYEGVPSLTGFYDFVKAASVGFDGTDPIRQIAFD